MIARLMLGLATTISAFMLSLTAAHAAEPINGRWVTEERDAVVLIRGCGNVTCAHFFDLLPVIGMHLQQPAYALFPILNRIEHGVFGFQYAGIDPEESEVAVFIIGDFKSQRSKGCIIA